MEQVPWSEDEWRQLTEGDEPVRHDPWGEPLTKTHPEALQDADYIEKAAKQQQEMAMAAQAKGSRR